jgi:hypothetical protein
VTHDERVVVREIGHNRLTHIERVWNDETTGALEIDSDAFSYRAGTSVTGDRCVDLFTPLLPSMVQA